MTRFHHLAAACFAALPILSPALAAQAQAELRPATADANLAPLAADAFVPLHAHPGDPGYGVWAGGPDWKARFDSGMSFFPRLGRQAARNLPWRWVTEGVSHGAALETPDAAAAAVFSPSRHERRHARFVERYDVRVDGVEQSFVVEAPFGEGDLVVAGRVTSELRAASREACHAPLEFTDGEGRTVLRYGAAFAIDAAGRVLPIGSEYRDGRIRLVVPAAWLAGASWPVTVDPLTQSTTINSFLDDVRAVGVARSAGHSERCVAFSRWFAANDHDLYMRTMDDTFTNRATVFSDLADDRDTPNVSLDYVAGAGRYVVAYDVQSGLDAFVRLYFHDAGGLAVGVTADLVPPLVFAYRAPSFGGAADQDVNGFLAFRRDLRSSGPDSEASRVFGVLVDANTRSVGAIVNLHTSVTVDYDAEAPCVSRASSNDDGWMVVWQEFNFENANDDWDVLGQRIHADGSLAGTAAFVLDGDSSLHKQRPKVAGSQSRFLVSCTTTSNAGTKPTTGHGTALRAQPFDWPSAAAAPTKLATRTVASANAVSLRLGEESGVLAHDFDTDSHWAVVWHEIGVAQRIARLGYDGVVVETALVQTESASANSFRAALCYDGSGDTFVLVTGASGGNVNVVGRHFDYAPASKLAYGASCAGSLIFVNQAAPHLPYAGSRSCALRHTNGRPSAPTWLFLALGPADLPLPESAAGCRLLLDPTILFFEFGSAMSSANGISEFPLALPSSLTPADLYWQCLQLENGQLHSSNALRTNVR